MATDPNLNSDTCIFMQPGSPNWWLSEDVKLAAASGVAVPGQKNDVNITVRRKAQDCTLPENTDFVKVDLYVCNPTASPTTTTSPNVKKILDATSAPASEILVDIASLPSGGSFAQTVKWDLPPLSGASHPAETAGHKCLIARAYPNPLSGGINIGDYAAPPSDQHYAQRNICVQTCSSPCGIDVWTENVNKERPQNVKFEVIADTQPSEEVLKVALPLLQQVPGFKRVVNGTPRKGFGLDLPDFPDAKKTDNTRPGCLGGITKIFGSGGAGFRPSFAAEVKLAPSQFSIYRFVTDLDGAQSGDAFIFHLTHIENGNVLSGLTMLMVKN